MDLEEKIDLAAKWIAESERLVVFTVAGISTANGLPDYHPYAPVKGQAFQLEIGRGCSHGCRFCMIG